MSNEQADLKLRASEFQPFQPYGKEWQKEMSQFPKAQLLEKVSDILAKKEAERFSIRRQLAKYDEVLCVRCGYNIEFVLFEGEGLRAECVRCVAQFNSTRLRLAAAVKALNNAASFAAAYDDGDNAATRIIAEIDAVVLADIAQTEGK